jgi:hypothetical protein
LFCSDGDAPVDGWDVEALDLEAVGVPRENVVELPPGEGEAEARNELGIGVSPGIMPIEPSEVIGAPL